MKELKLLKGLLKKQIRFDMSILVVFLITGSIGYGVNITTDLVNDENIVEVEDNGINLKGNEINISNNGIIIGDSTFGKNRGNGITSVSNIGDITNNGLIYGHSIGGSTNSGNGITSVSNIEDIANNGLISGYSDKTNELDQGNGIRSGINIGNINNNGLISGYSKDSKDNSGNGVSIYRETNLDSDISLGDVTNNGLISGYTSPETPFIMKGVMGNGISIYNSQSDHSTASIGNIINNGLISGYAFIVRVGAPALAIGNGISSFNRTSTDYSNGASNIGNITNNGSISGYSDNGGNYSHFGNGITSFSSNSTTSTTSDNSISIASIGNIINNGLISGYSTSTISSIQGNAISAHSNSGYSDSTSIASIGNIINNGLISGYSAAAYDSGNGISSTSTTTTANPNSTSIASIGNITNNGLISGYSVSDRTGSGNGINTFSYSVSNKNSNTIQNIVNNGLIKGGNQSIRGSYTSLVNGGILAGKTIVDSGNVFANEGVTITLNVDNSGNITQITNGNGGKVTVDGSDKIVINGTEVGTIAIANTIITTGDSYLLTSNLVDKGSNLIINGAGIDKGALVVDEDTILTSSIVNGYNTAVYIESGKILTATDTTFNGGGLKNDVTIIKGDDGSNVLNVLGTSIINGAVDLGNGNDKLSIGNSVQINGKLDGGLGEDILNLGEAFVTKIAPNLNILHDITGFENINTNGDITLFETVKITGADNITLESGNLVLRVDSTVTVDGKVTGHALYGNNGTLTSSNGNLVIGLNGLGEDAIISMGRTTITSETNDSWWKETDHIKTNSLVLDANLTEDGKDINITVLESIPLAPSIPTPPVDPPVIPTPPIVIDSLLYEKLNKVYQSIVSAGEVGNLANTTLLEDKTYNESLGGLLTILDQIYTNNPYAYTLKSSKDSLKLFEDNLSYLTIKPKKDEMIVQGKVIYTGVKNDSSASGKNYYGFDTNHRNYKTTTNTVGGLATFEYGLNDNISVGFVFGGNNQDVKFKGSSKIKGNSLYLGTFAKTDIKNFKFMSGVGYQYTSADADRKVSNGYDSFATGDKYDINSLNAFIEAKYIYNAEQDWTVEPKVRLSYYYIDQNKINEGYTPGQISMRTDKVNSNTADVEIGVDFVKSLYLNNGKLKNILSLGVINTVGDKSKELNGYILGKEKDGKKFDIQGAELPKTSGKVSYNLELEQTNGMVYTAGVSLEVAKDYNRNINATVGIGYRF